MKILSIIFLLTVSCFNLSAQVFIKGEYIGSSKYKDIDGNETGGKGDATVLSGGIQIPLSMKMNENNRITAWGIGLAGSYTSLSNKNIPKSLCPSEILNAQTSLTHLRPISKNWSIMASAGFGVYMGHTNLSKVKMKNVLGHGGVIFIWHLKDNLDIGLGPAINTAFGYPMAFPAFYVNWRLSGRYEVNASMMNSLQISASMAMGKNFRLGIISEADGSLSLEKIDGKDKMFTHNYIIAGLRPEFRFGKLSIPVTIGISADRVGYYTDRNLKAFFKTMSREHDPYFKVAPYLSVALAYKF